MPDRILKPWGESETLLEAGDFRLTRIMVRRGGYCSRHRHEHQHNTFVIVSGKLRVCLLVSLASGATAEYRLLEDGLQRSVTILAGQVHWFVAETDAIALEIYTRDGLVIPCEQDIVRFTDGGLLPPDREDQDA